MSNLVTRNRLDLAEWCSTGTGRLTRPTLARLANDNGLAGLELAPARSHRMLRNLGLQDNMLIPYYGRGSEAPFTIGLGSHKQTWQKVKRVASELIDRAQKLGFPNVIVFTGYGKPGTEMQAICVERLVELGRIAEKAGNVTLCLEHLNNKKFDVPGGEMMGHPGYMGNNIDWVAEIVTKARQQLDTPTSVALLYDFYHVEIMHPGQAIAKFQQHERVIGHVHVAQHPGRAALTAKGKLNFSEVAETLNRSNFDGYVGLEFPSPANIDHRRLGAQNVRKELEDSIKILIGE